MPALQQHVIGPQSVFVYSQAAYLEESQTPQALLVLSLTLFLSTPIPSFALCIFVLLALRGMTHLSIQPPHAACGYKHSISLKSNLSDMCHTYNSPQNQPL